MARDCRVTGRSKQINSYAGLPEKPTMNFRFFMLCTEQKDHGKRLPPPINTHKYYYLGTGTLQQVASSKEMN